MALSLATTFDELVGRMVVDAPHALVLDWYRRLELASVDYRNAHGVRSRDLERFMASDPMVGEKASAEYRQLRHMRNRVAHQQAEVSGSEAAAFARHALILIGKLAISIDAVSAA